MKNTVILFIIITYLLSWFIDFVIPDYADLMMFIPGLVAFLFVALNQEKILKLLSLGSLKNMVIGCFVPISAFALVVLLSKSFSLAEIGLSTEAIAYNNGSRLQAWSRFLILGLPYMLCISCVFSFFEEIGWRGFLLRKLSDMKSFSFMSRSLIVGVVWGVWHIPMYLMSGTPVLSIIIFLINVCFISIIFTWLFEKQYSIWPTVFAHAIHNTLFNVVLPTLMLAKTGSNIFYGEEGLLVLAAYSAIVIIGCMVPNMFPSVRVLARN